jgi:hypothetical protein
VLVSAYLYPWDVDDDPAAADRIAGLGLDEVVLAAAYHAVRAVTPFHPRHRIVTRDAAVYYRTDPARWRGAALRPAEADPRGSFERAAARLIAAGLRVSAWAVLAHGCGVGAGNPSWHVRNAYGDGYPWALCIGSPEVRDYVAALAAEVAALGGAGAVELEACGWYGIDHGSVHDKTAGAAVGPGAEWLLSVCFCAACVEAYWQAGADPEELRAAVRAALDSALGWGGAVASRGPADTCELPSSAPADAGELPSSAPADAGELPSSAPADAGELLPSWAADVLLRVRADVAERAARQAIAAVRAAAPGKQVLVHAHPDPRAAGSNPGYDPSVLLGPGGADGIVLSCSDPATAGQLVARTAAAAPPGARIAASLQAVSGLGGRPETLSEQAETVRAAGATELRLYHAGLASASDLAAIRSLRR